MNTRTDRSSAPQLRFPFFLLFLALPSISPLLLSSCSGDDDDADAGDADTDSDSDTYPELAECAGGGGAYDPESDLCWQDPPADGETDWQAAVDSCDGLSLGGDGDWRLPTISELRTLIRGCAATETGGDCYVNDECLEWLCWADSCDGCGDLGGPAADGCYWNPALTGTCDSWYWSSGSYADDEAYAWGVYFYSGVVSTGLKSGAGSARCVRSGQ
jgi:hypothetical protein